jgi:ppGpp synthetase/RelA/SpoT-type nucleotidyltranferase
LQLFIFEIDYWSFRKICGAFMKRDGLVPVPASPADVRAFIDQTRVRYEADLKAVRLLIDKLSQTDPRLRSVYKIYSRGDLQGIDELKSARKIRLKFNEWNKDKLHNQASLFDTPDVVGLTIVVPYPTGIDAVAGAIDDAVDKKLLNAVQMGVSDLGSTIKTRHGRGLDSKGYSACHYNLRIPGAGKRPIVEVQIKTLLHDAWGAKTHDLTYKPSGRIGEELLASFDLLGTNLANLDRQSDALRTSILRAAEVRERKRSAIQVAILAKMADDALQTVGDHEILINLKKLESEIMCMSPDAQPDECYRIYTKLVEVFDEGNSPSGVDVAASTLLSLLAAKTLRASDFDHAQDIIDFRVDEESDNQKKLTIQLEGVLTAFAGGNVPEAIDLCEDIAQNIDMMVSTSSVVIDPSRFLRQRISIYSNLAYFHADLVGSHEGDKRESSKAARTYLANAKTLYPDAKFPPDGLLASNQDIIEAVTSTNEQIAIEVFFAMDSEAYVGIQCAENEHELRTIKQRLEFLHSYEPDPIKYVARLAVDYHDYCARIRLGELESAKGLI